MHIRILFYTCIECYPSDVICSIFTNFASSRCVYINNGFVHITTMMSSDIDRINQPTVSRVYIEQPKYVERKVNYVVVHDHEKEFLYRYTHDYSLVTKPIIFLLWLVVPGPIYTMLNSLAQHLRYLYETSEISSYVEKTIRTALQTGACCVVDARRDYSALDDYLFQRDQQLFTYKVCSDNKDLPSFNNNVDERLRDIDEDYLTRFLRPYGPSRKIYPGSKYVSSNSKYITKRQELSCIKLSNLMKVSTSLIVIGSIYTIYIMLIADQLSGIGWTSLTNWTIIPLVFGNALAAYVLVALGVQIRLNTRATNQVLKYDKDGCIPEPPSPIEMKVKRNYSEEISEYMNDVIRNDCYDEERLPMHMLDPHQQDDSSDDRRLNSNLSNSDDDHVIERLNRILLEFKANVDRASANEEQISQEADWTRIASARGS
jgi:hypothetical protein